MHYYDISLTFEELTEFIKILKSSNGTTIDHMVLYNNTTFISQFTRGNHRSGNETGVVYIWSAQFPNNNGRSIDLTTNSELRD